MTPERKLGLATLDLAGAAFDLSRIANVPLLVSHESVAHIALLTLLGLAMGTAVAQGVMKKRHQRFVKHMRENGPMQ